MSDGRNPVFRGTAISGGGAAADRFDTKLLQIEALEEIILLGEFSDRDLPGVGPPLVTIAGCLLLGSPPLHLRLPNN